VASREPTSASSRSISFRYLDEQAFRFNNRKADDWSRCSELTSQVLGKRVTYAELTGKLGETQN
jgi:hypothetical protein